ncbi:MAG: hypothetical protein AMXMBFR34_18020 [Myxococcaceae bacterium]
MALTEAQLKEAARDAYERSRVARALAVAAPVAVLPLVSFLLGTSRASASLLGVALVTVVALGVWRGGAVALSSAAGLKAGLVPLLFAHGAKAFGHVCTPAGCTSLCVPACAAGGVLAGALVEWWARRSPRPHLTRALGAGVAVLTGGLGCACVGYAGLLALLVGLALSMGAGRLVPRPAGGRG